jgi:hypothetical protein
MKTATAVPFKKAINRITRKTSEAKALPRFKLLLAEDIRQRSFRDRWRGVNEREVERILQENLEYHREKGFDPREVKYFEDLYSSQPRCGPRKKDRFFLDRAQKAQTGQDG